MEDALLPLPTPSGLAFSFSPCCPNESALVELVTKLRCRGNHVGTKLVNDCETTHAIILHKDCKPLIDDEAVAKGNATWKTKPSSWKVGFDLNTEVGDRIAHSRWRFLAFISKVFHAKSPNRLLLDDGDIVLKCEGQREQEDPYGCGLLASIGRTGVGLNQDVFWHIAFYQHSPRELFIREVYVEPEQPFPNEIQLKASHVKMCGAL